MEGYSCKTETKEYRNILVKVWDNYLQFSIKLIVLGFNDTSTLFGHFVSSPRKREKRDRRGDEREGQGRERDREEKGTGKKVKKQKK